MLQSLSRQIATPAVPIKLNAAPPAPPATPSDSAQLSPGAFRKGVSAAADMTTDLVGMGAGAVLGLMAAGTAASAVAFMAGATTLAGGPPLACLLVMGAGAVAGGVGGAKVADWIGKKVDHLGAVVSEKLGASALTGGTVGRAGLALAATAPLSLTRASAAGAPMVVGGAAITAGLLLAGGVANKAASWLVDQFRK